MSVSVLELEVSGDLAKDSQMLSILESFWRLGILEGLSIEAPYERGTVDLICPFLTEYSNPKLHYFHLNGRLSRRAESSFHEFL
jgi:hypothetical protein